MLQETYKSLWVRLNLILISDLITDTIGLEPIQKIAITEKYRPIYEKQAKENLVSVGGDRKSDEYKKEETRNTDAQSNMNNKKEKRVVENGVILLPENSEENKLANDICRRMKSGDADWDKINNDMELNNIKQIVNDNIDISISYIRSNLNFDNFNSSNLERLREIINEANEKMNILMKDMEELVNE